MSKPCRVCGRAIPDPLICPTIADVDRNLIIIRDHLDGAIAGLGRVDGEALYRRYCNDLLDRRLELATHQCQATEATL